MLKIVFDVGNVLLKYDLDYIMDNLGIKNKAIIRKYLHDSPEWVMLDGGYFPEQELLDRMKENMHQGYEDGFIDPSLDLAVLDKEAETSFWHWHEYFISIKETQELVEELKSMGYETYVLSNAGVRYDEYKDVRVIFSYMNGVYISAFHKLLKPDLRIYQDFLRIFNLEAKDCLFIDDLASNVSGAIDAGMDAIKFTGDIRELRCALRRKGVMVHE